MMHHACTGEKGSSPPLQQINWKETIKMARTIGGLISAPPVSPLPSNATVGCHQRRRSCQHIESCQRCGQLTNPTHFSLARQPFDEMNGQDEAANRSPSFALALRLYKEHPRHIEKEENTQLKALIG